MSTSKEPTVAEHYEIKDLVTFSAQQPVEISVSAKDNRAVLRRIDLCLLPLLCGTFFLQFLDKQALSYGAVIGLVADLKLHGSQYSLLTTFFYIGLLVFEYPANFLLLRYHKGRVLGILVTLWGICLACLSTAKSFSGLAAGRFFLGSLEAVVVPSMMLFTASYYARREQPLRTAIWYLLQGFALGIGGLIAYALEVSGGSLRPWRKLFLIDGCVTVGWGIILIVFTPDDIISTHWLSPSQKVMATERLRHEKIPIAGHEFKKYQALEAIRDPNVILLVLYSFFANWSPALNAFSPLLVAGLTKNPLHATLLNVPSGAFSMIAIAVVCLTATFIPKTRCILMASTYLLSVVATAIIVGVPRKHPWVLLFGIWLSATGPAGFTLSLSVATSNITGRTKQITTNALIFVAFALGNIASPQLFLARQAPNYRTGIYGVMATSVAAAICALLLRLNMASENRKRDAEALVSGLAAVEHDANEGFHDKTDRENRSFRYMY